MLVSALTEFRLFGLLNWMRRMPGWGSRSPGACRRGQAWRRLSGQGRVGGRRRLRRSPLSGARAARTTWQRGSSDRLGWGGYGCLRFEDDDVFDLAVGARGAFGRRRAAVSLRIGDSGPPRLEGMDAANAFGWDLWLKLKSLPKNVNGKIDRLGLLKEFTAHDIASASG